jgi:circadian clock protein KaiB
MSELDEPLDARPSYRLRLFIAGNTDRSRRAIENLRRICAEHLEPCRIDLEVVDIYQQPELAAPNQVIAAPTLVKLLPLPVRRIIGDLSETDHVLQGLELIPVSPAAEPHGS